MREIRPSGSEGGAAQTQCAVPTPILRAAEGIDGSAVERATHSCTARAVKNASYSGGARDCSRWGNDGMRRPKSFLTPSAVAGVFRVRAKMDLRQADR
jgi:hypothetical protein